MFADNLNAICKMRGTNLTTLVKKMGVSTSSVTSWNHGAIPKQEMLIRLAKELDCRVADFFLDEDDLKKDYMPTINNSISDVSILGDGASISINGYQPKVIPHDGYEELLLKIYRNLSFESRTDAIQYMKSLEKKDKNHERGVQGDENC